MVSKALQDTPKIRKPIAWATWISTITAVGALFIGYAAMKTQTVQNAPYIALQDVSTAPNPYQHEKGAQPALDTEVIFKNNGATQAIHLNVMSLGWFSVSASDTYTTPSMKSFLRTEKLQITSPWEATSSSDTLDRDQPTRQVFPDFPRSQEPLDATDHLYIEINYDDDFMRPFREHHTAEFCIVKLPAGTDAGSLHGWHQSTLEDCLVEYKHLTATQKDGPIRY